MRSRTGALRDDNPKRHPDNAPGQDPCPSRKIGQTLGARQSLFSLSSSRERGERLKCDLSRLFKTFSVQRLLDRDAETSSDDKKMMYSQYP